jgi:hypothetical protein
MTVSSEQSSVTYTGNGVTTLFAIPYYFLSKTHIQVSLTDSAGVVIPKVLDIDYTVAGAGNEAGGSLTFLVAPPNLSNLVVARNVPATQLTEYRPNDDFPAESHERALDKLTMIAQQVSAGLGSVNTQLGKTVRTPEAIPVLPDAASRAGKLLTFDAAGNPIATAAGSGSATELAIALADPNQGSELVAAPGAGTVAQALGMTSVAQDGAVGSGNEAAKLISACARAVAQGHKRVFIPFPSFNGGLNTDCQDCEIYGSNTDLTGYLINHKGLFNIKVFTVNQSFSTKSDEIPVDRTTKLLWRQSATNDYCIVQKARGYALLGFVINSTTTSESLATTTSEPTRRRLSEALDAIWAGVYKFTFSAESGAWTTQSISNPANIIPAYTSGRALTSRFTVTNGDYAEYLIFPKGGMVQFALFTGASSTATATVSVNGTLAATITPVSAVGSTIKVFSISALGNPDSQAVTVRITHTGTNGTRLQLIGANFYELKDWDGTEHDRFAYFRNSSFADYLTQSSANDCVIREFNSDLYGISYHGGETNIVSDWLVNHAIASPALDGYVVSRDIIHKNKADVSWAAFGGGAITIRADWIPKFGGVTHAATINGNIVVNELYTHMFGTPESFTEVIEPKYIDFTGVANGVRTPGGRTTNATMRNPTTGQEIRMHMSIYEREQNRYGGIHFWKVIGSYIKAYGAISLNGKMLITDLSLVSGISLW